MIFSLTLVSSFVRHLVDVNAIYPINIGPLLHKNSKQAAPAFPLISSGNPTTSSAFAPRALYHKYPASPTAPLSEHSHSACLPVSVTFSQNFLKYYSLSYNPLQAYAAPTPILQLSRRKSSSTQLRPPISDHYLIRSLFSKSFTTNSSIHQDFSSSLARLLKATVPPCAIVSWTLWLKQPKLAPQAAVAVKRTRSRRFACASIYWNS